MTDRSLILRRALERIAALAHGEEPSARDKIARLAEAALAEHPAPISLGVVDMGPRGRRDVNWSHTSGVRLDEGVAVLPRTVLLMNETDEHLTVEVQVDAASGAIAFRCERVAGPPERKELIYGRNRSAGARADGVKCVCESDDARECYRARYGRNGFDDLGIGGECECACHAEARAEARDEEDARGV